jgi:phosphoribosylformylglycinamidine synthase
MTAQRYIKHDTPFGFITINLIEANDRELMRVSHEMGLALNITEMQAVKAYFTKQGRKPTDVELQTIGQTWSEHCYHKVFKGDVVTSTGEPVVQSMLKSYIIAATDKLNPPWCYSVFEDNAGIVEFDQGYGIAVKVETHNHPSAVEPFGGAATGTGGVIRDPLGVWAEPIACTDVLCFGPLDYEYADLPEGVKHPRYIHRGVVAAIGYYGNNMGIPTVNGAVYFDEGYVGNPLVYCGCVGILPLDKYIRDTRPGDAAVLVGGRTGRDGIHGVTFASLELTEESEASRPAVQIPNPIEEEKVRRGIIRVRDLELASAITDLGGGGLSSAVGEMAHRSNCGVEVQLTRVPLKVQELDPWEIWISESQERMLLSVRKANLQAVLDIFKEEDVKANCIGGFTDDGRARLYHDETLVADLDLAFLFDAPKLKLVATWAETQRPAPGFPEATELTDDLLAVLATPNVASKESVIRTYDHEVQGNTVLKPLQGKYSGPNDAAVIKPLQNSWQGIAVSCGMNPRYGKIDPYWMAASAIDEAIRNNLAVGGRRVALLDNFCWGNPEKPDRLGGLVRAAKACHDFALALTTPFVSGKDSLYNESPLGPVTPSLLITGVGIVPDIRRVVSVDLKKPGDLIYIVGETRDELGGSEYYRLKGRLGRNVPTVDAASMSETMKAIPTAIDRGYVKACHDLSEGGIAVTAAEMAFAGSNGVELTLDQVPTSLHRNDSILFSESNSRFLLESPEECRDALEDVLKDVRHAVVGRVIDDDRFTVYGLNNAPIVDTSIGALRIAWKSTFGG